MRQCIQVILTERDNLMLIASIQVSNLVNYNWAVAWDFQQFGTCNQQRLRPACAYAQTDQSLCWSLKYSMTVKLLTEPHLRFLNLKGGCTGLSESTPVEIPHSWKSGVTAQLPSFMRMAIISLWPWNWVRVNKTKVTSWCLNDAAKECHNRQTTTTK